MLSESIRALWAKTHLQVWPEQYWLVSMPHGACADAARMITMSVANGAHFAVLVVEPDEVSLTIADTIWQRAAASIAQPPSPDRIAC